ncbi:MAG: biotin--[acetyl-CoA-carboxylase] ligase [Xanthomonadales bacterium]|nr:biotin--[acetyl-CoA-carboxylase] ligase [Xanthomonadales bacterium]
MAGAAAADVLSGEAIRLELSREVRERLQRLTVLDEADSTNAVLARLPEMERHAHAVLAEAQTAGRGRRERRWHSPAGGNIYLSLGWRFGAGPRQLSNLPLLAAVCVCAALDRAGLRGHGVKWPNDVLMGGAKLAGILVESQSRPDRSVLAVIGVGLNVRMPGMPPAIDRPWTDLVTHLPADRRGISRNRVAADLLDELVPACERFAREGFASFRAEWMRRDLLAGRRIALEDNGAARYGTALGIDDSGGLAVDLDDIGQQVLHAADVSILDA